MSDIKRVVFTTLEPQKSSDKVVKKHFKTVRICVALPESNEDKCPEYNYKDEVAAVKKKGKQQNTKEVNNVPNGLDPLDPFDNENDDDVRRIAIEMEAKYGTGVSNNPAAKKRRKGRKDDYADIGAGYDENDSFIDNTDGYDEIIPPNVTTARGGFYINSGALEFKEDNDATSEVSSSSSSEEESESEEESAEAAKPRKKRALDTTDEEDAASDHNSKEQEEKVANDAGVKPNISMQQAIKKKLFSHDKIQVKKRKLLEQQKKTVKNLLDERRTDSTTAENVVEKDSLKENKKPMRLSSVDDAINSVISRMETTPSTPKILESKETKADTSKKEQSNRNGEQHSSPDVETVSPPAPVDIVKLPESLPTDIIGIIENIKKAARDYKDGGKVKFFSGEVNVMLLNLERKCKVLGRSSRVRVYEHLAPFVKCRKETLVKRAKNLVIEDEQKKLKVTIDKLKCQVDQLMPSLLTNHEHECQKVLQRKFSPEAANSEDLKNLKAPRRRFPLSEDMRRMIREIVNLKKRCFIHEGKDKNALEDHLANYLKKEILPIWPEGWMSMAVLKKFCTMSAIKTPDPKSLGHAPQNPNKHSQKSQTSSAPSTIINLSSGSNLTITPVNLTEKFSEVRSGNSVGGQKVQPDMVIKPVKEKLVEKHQAEMRSGNGVGGQKVQPETVIKPVKEKHQAEVLVVEAKDRTVDRQKDNGVIVINTVEPAPVIPNKATTHCQVIDLTDSPFRPLTVKPPEELSAFPLLKAHAEASKSLSTNFEQTIKQKFPGISVTTTTGAAHDKDDVQKVMESLKALQKLSSPSKNDSGGSPVSVIAFNKSYSNSGSGSQATGSVGNERTNFSGAIGYQDEFQKQFISSLNNHRSPPAATAASTKPNYNRCS